MPSILEPVAAEKQAIDFVASVPLDLLNAMYFTALASNMEALDDFPVQTRARMDPLLRHDLDFLFTYPTRQPGIMGALNDILFTQPTAVGSVDALLRYVRDLPGTIPADRAPSIQGLALYALRECGLPFPVVPAAADASAVLRAALAVAQPAVDDHPTDIEVSAETALELFDQPEQVRARMLTLIRRFYDEHYRPDEERRLACLRRSVAYHRDVERRRQEPADIDELIASLTASHGRPSCISQPTSDYARFIFLPSVDVGPYISRIDLAPAFALYYPCEPQFRGDAGRSADSSHRAALIYKALSDEQRLQILRELRGRELYAQEIVERTELHQSVVSRHLSLLKAVGLVNVRRQNNMKFYSLNSEMREELRQTIDAVLPANG